MPVLKTASTHRQTILARKNHCVHVTHLSPSFIVTYVTAEAVAHAILLPVLFLAYDALPKGAP